MNERSDTMRLDLQHPFAVDAGLGRLRTEADYAAHVRQLLVQLLLTAPGERWARPDFGCGLRRALFAPGGEVAASLAQVSVRQAVDEWLSEVVRVEDVEVNAVDSRIEVKLVYRLRLRPAGVQILNLALPQ